MSRVETAKMSHSPRKSVSTVRDLCRKGVTEKVSFEFRVKEWRCDGWRKWRREGWAEISMKR